MTLRALAGTSPLACMLVALCVASVAGGYWMIYADYAEELARARSAYDQISWVAVAEPGWRTEFAHRLEILKADPELFVAPTPQDAASEFQSKLRQSLAGAGAAIDSLQSSTTASTDEELPMIRAVATARIAAERAIDVVQAIEAIQPRIAIEGLDISIQAAGSPQAPERVAIMTITARAYVMTKTDAIN